MSNKTEVIRKFNELMQNINFRRCVETYQLTIFYPAGIPQFDAETLRRFWYHERSKMLNTLAPLTTKHYEQFIDLWQTMPVQWMSEMQDALEYYMLEYFPKDHFFVIEEGIVTEFLSTLQFEVVIPEMIRGQVVKGIGKRAFYGLELGAIEIPSSVERIEEEAFAYNNLQTLILPKYCKEIQSKAFAYNALSEIIYPLQASIAPDAFEGNDPEGGLFEKKQNGISTPYTHA